MYSCFGLAVISISEVFHGENLFITLLLGKDSLIKNSLFEFYNFFFYQRNLHHSVAPFNPVRRTQYSSSDIQNANSENQVILG